MEGWLEEVSRKLNQANVLNHDAGFGSVRRLLSPEDMQTESGWPYLQSRRSRLSQESRVHDCLRRMLNVADVKSLLQPGVNAANATLLKSQCFGVTT